MTFYWWSHWFWITVMSNIFFFFSLIVVVHTYPSQDSSQEFNLHQTENSRKLVTKLYQTSTTSWSTESSMVARSTTAEKTVLQSVTMSGTSVAVTPPPPSPPLSPLPSTTSIRSLSASKKQDTGNKDGFEDYYYDQEDETQTKQIDLEEVEEEMESKSRQKQEFVPEAKENDIKRSAEHFAKPTNTESKIMELNPTESSTSAGEEKTNYTNYTNISHKVAISTNATMSTVTPVASSKHTNHISSDSNSDSVAASSLYSSASALSPVLSTLTNSSNNDNIATVLPHAPPATPKIVKTHNPLDWLNRMADVAVSPPTARVTTDVNDDRFPFTLENVHKSEDLRRDESEPRTRKSKGLSAEYKHGYASINYSTSESKNLLTRSASTTVNEYESEESNISSEALSVQRAYFMDVGAISAICFTVFGICCTVGTIGIVLYRRRFLNKPQALSEPDSSVYIDDSTMRVSDNSDEMYSLDNDSFLNSLEAMTIQNYWTDTVKHTKL